MFKDGPENIKSNYRPVSVLPTVSRLFEKVLVWPTLPIPG